MALLEISTVFGIILLASDVHSQQRLYEGDICKSKNEERWKCEKLENCPSALKEIKQKRPEMCGFSGNSLLVCCQPDKASPPTLQPPFLSIDREKPSQTAETLRPDNKPTKISTPQTPISASLVQTKSEIKCLEYQKYVYKKQSVVPLALEIDYGDGSFTDTNDAMEDTCAVKEEALIYEGKPAAPKEFPHQVLIGYDVKRKVEWMCGGSLISETFVLTAAHCAKTKAGPARWVRTGDLDYKHSNDRANPQQLKIIENIIHPGYLSDRPYNDIALMRLEKAVSLDEFSRPACLHTGHDIAEKQAIASGWGTTENGTTSTILLKVRLDLIGREKCNEYYEKSLRVGIADDKMVCAGDLKGIKDTCRGDSGGPLQNQMTTPYCMYNIIGVTSIGRGKCGSSQPGVYTRVSHYVKWIEDIVWP